jgi:hypothetical protein
MHLIINNKEIATEYNIILFKKRFVNYCWIRQSKIKWSYMNHKKQRVDVKQRMNKDLENLSNYAKQWHQPINGKKTQVVLFKHIVQHAKLNLYYEDTIIDQTKVFRYLCYQMDSKLSFKTTVDDKLKKCRQTYSILKHMHRPFPTFYKLKLLSFNTYIWPHLFSMSSIFCLLSNSLRERINSFYRRCLRMIYHLFECPTKDPHIIFHPPTLEENFRKNLMKRLSSIERHEQQFISCYIMYKTIINKIRQHYLENPCIPSLPRGRSGTHMIEFYQDTATYFDKLLQFTVQSVTVIARYA